MSLLTQQQQKFSYLVGQLLLYAYSIGYGITLSDAWRSEEEQLRLFNAGYSKIKSNGFHQRRLAIDLNIFINDVYTEEDKYYEVLAVYWKSLDSQNIWGGDFKNFSDIFHYQYTS